MTEHKYLTQFIGAVGTVFESFSPRRILCTGFHAILRDDSPCDISVMIEIVGDMRATVYMSMENRIGRQIASELLGGMEIGEDAGELIVSAVSELGNMIMGNACTEIGGAQLSLDITPPTVHMGGTRHRNSMTFYNIPVELENLGVIDFDVAMQTA